MPLPWFFLPALTTLFGAVQNVGANAAMKEKNKTMEESARRLEGLAERTRSNAQTGWQNTMALARGNPQAYAAGRQQHDAATSQANQYTSAAEQTRQQKQPTTSAIGAGLARIFSPETVFDAGVGYLMGPLKLGGSVAKGFKSGAKGIGSAINAVKEVGQTVGQVGLASKGAVDLVTGIKNLTTHQDPKAFIENFSKFSYPWTYPVAKDIWLSLIHI